MLVFLNIGYALAVVKVIDQPKPVIWVCVSVYLAVTAIFYAGMLGANTERRLDALMRGYVAAAVVASLVGIAAYFRVFGSASDMFLLYERARGTFNDPNVLGAFVILPALLALQRVLIGRLSDMVRGGLVLLVLMAGLLLSFSRGAWGQLALGAIVLTGLIFITSRSPRQRVRIIALTLIGAFVVVVFIAALLSIGAVAKLFEVRASLEQSYDIGHLGRFGRYALGFQVALDEPFGIGPLQFTRLFMSGGWLAGVSYFTLVLISVMFGARFLTVATPWQPTYQAVYVAYLGTVGESVVVDIDHWRHYFLILGVLWGLMAASWSYSRNSYAGSQQSSA